VLSDHLSPLYSSSCLVCAYVLILSLIFSQAELSRACKIENASPVDGNASFGMSYCAIPGVQCAGLSVVSGSRVAELSGRWAH